LTRNFPYLFNKGAVDDKSAAPQRESFDTSFDLKQPKLESKLISALSKTKRLFWLFCFYTITANFSVWIEQKQTEYQPKQFDREHILIFFRKFWVVSVCFETVCFCCFASLPKKQVSVFRLNRNKQKTSPPTV
jgi:hypothetical protein